MKFSIDKESLGVVIQKAISMNSGASEAEQNTVECLKSIIEYDPTIDQEPTKEQKIGLHTALNLAGIVWGQSKEYKQAIVILREAYELYHEDATKDNLVTYLFEEANDNAQLKEYTVTINLLEELLVLDPEQKCPNLPIDVVEFLADTYEQHAVGLANLGQNEEAISYCEKALALNTEHEAAKKSMSIVYTKLGRDHYKSKRLEDAILSFTKAVEYNPENASAKKDLAGSHAQYGIYLSKANEESLAVDHLRKAYELDKTHEFSRINLSLALLNLAVAKGNSGDQAGAEALLIESLEVNPENAKVKANYAVLLLDQGLELAMKDKKFEEAKVKLEKAFEFDPENGRVKTNLAAIYAELGVALANKGDFESATNLLLKAFELDSSNKCAKENLSICLKVQGVQKANAGDSDGAIELLEKAIAVNPEHAEAKTSLSNLYVNISKVRFESKDFDGVVEVLQKALEYYPENPQAISNLSVVFAEIAVIQANSGNAKAAEEYLRKSLELNPENEFAKVNLSVLSVDFGVELANGKNYEESLAKLTEALSLDPTSSRAQENLEILQGLMGAGAEGISDSAE